MLLRPLFFTSFLIDDQLDDEGLTERGPIVISSASSKTAIAAAFLLARRDGVELIGLTSARNSEFVAGLGIYGRTVTYDEIGSLGRGPATYVDISGDGEVRQAVHTHFGDDLAHSMAVGVTHWEELGSGQGDLPGPAPAFFFAPSRVEKRSDRLGPRRARAPRRRGLAPLLRVDRRLARDDPRRGLRGPRERLPRRARGPRRPKERPRNQPRSLPLTPTASRSGALYAALGHIKRTGRRSCDFEHAGDAVHHGGWFVSDLAPCDPRGAVASGDEDLVAQAIALESHRRSMCLFAVRLNCQPLLLPKQIHLEAVPIDAHLHVASRSRKTLFDQSRQ